MRILSIDYGLKRCGLAWTDPLQISISGLGAVPPGILEQHLGPVIADGVSTIVLGYPTRSDGSDSHVTDEIRQLYERLKLRYPDKEVYLWDESFSSRSAARVLFESGVSKKKRQEKSRLDEMSAILILRDFLLSKT